MHDETHHFSVHIILPQLFCMSNVFFDFMVSCIFRTSSFRDTH